MSSNPLDKFDGLRLAHRIDDVERAASTRHAELETHEINLGRRHAELKGEIRFLRSEFNGHRIGTETRLVRIETSLEELNVSINAVLKYHGLLGSAP